MFAHVWNQGDEGIVHLGSKKEHENSKSDWSSRETRNMRMKESIAWASGVSLISTQTHSSHLREMSGEVGLTHDIVCFFAKRPLHLTCKDALARRVYESSAPERRKHSPITVEVMVAAIHCR
jgi:hypothetical protein